MAFLVPDDLAPFATIDAAKAAAMIEDAESMAALAAPCITDPEFAVRSELVGPLKELLRAAILRWHDAGSGAVQNTQVGPFGQTVDTRTPRRGMFWPSEIDQLRDLCARFNNVQASSAFDVDTIGPRSGAAGHAPWCDLMFLGQTCSCGVALGRIPEPRF